MGEHEMILGRLVKARMVSGRLIKGGWSSDDLSSGRFINGRMVKHPSNEEISTRHCETYEIAPTSKISLDPSNVF